MQDSARSSSKPVRSARRNRERLRVSVSETMVSGSTNTCIMHGRPRLVGTVIRLRVAHPQALVSRSAAYSRPVFTLLGTLIETFMSRPSPDLPTVSTFSVFAIQIHIYTLNVLQVLCDNIMVQLLNPSCPCKCRMLLEQSNET